MKRIPTPDETAIALLEALPKSHSDADLVFKSLCIAYSREDVLTLRQKLIDAAEWLTSYVLDNDGPDVTMGGALCARAIQLVDSYDTFDEDQKALAVGAVRYFLFRLDDMPDHRGAQGYEDDRMVMNHALLRLGMRELLINLPLDSSEATSDSKSVSKPRRRGCEVWAEWKRRRAAP